MPKYAVMLNPPPKYERSYTVYKGSLKKNGKFKEFSMLPESKNLYADHGLRGVYAPTSADILVEGYPSVY